MIRGTALTVLNSNLFSIFNETSLIYLIKYDQTVKN